jgi:hypothetical protein
VLTVLLGVAVVAAMGAGAFAWQATSPRRERRRVHRDRIRAWQAELERLDGAAVDAMPRTGGPPGGDA